MKAVQAGTVRPEFLIIGAAKSATTWIAAQLRDRGDVFLPGPEPHYFSREYHRGPEWYARWFADAPADVLVGEKSADYLADPAVPGRLAHDCPDGRLIALLRSPVERAYSDYCMWYRRGDVGADVAAYLDPARTPIRRFLDDGLYARHLARFRDHMPAESLLVLLHDEVATRPAALIRKVTDFLGLEPARALASERRVNDSAAPLLPLALRRLPRPIKRALEPLRSAAAGRAVREALARRPVYPPFDPELRRRVADFYARDIEALSAMLNRDLGGWLQLPRADAA